MQYCFAFSENLQEEDELVLWLLELVTKDLEEHGGWSLVRLGSNCWELGLEHTRPLSPVGNSPASMGKKT